MEIKLETCYRRGWWVRRRRFRDRVYLVHFNRLFSLDLFSTGVWNACDGTRIPLEIAAASADSNPEIDRGHAGLLALDNLEYFLRNDLIVAVDAG